MKPPMTAARERSGAGVKVVSPRDLPRGAWEITVMMRPMREKWWIRDTRRVCKWEKRERIPEARAKDGMLKVHDKTFTKAYVEREINVKFKMYEIYKKTKKISKIKEHCISVIYLVCCPPHLAAAM